MCDGTISDKLFFLKKANGIKNFQGNALPLAHGVICQDFRPSVQHDCLWLGGSWPGFSRVLLWGAPFRINSSQIILIQSLFTISGSNHPHRYPNLSFGQEASKMVQDAEGIKDSHDRRPFLRFRISHGHVWRWMVWCGTTPYTRTLGFVGGNFGIRKNVRKWLFMFSISPNLAT